MFANHISIGCIAAGRMLLDGSETAEVNIQWETLDRSLAGDVW
jgi:hypothetical protein